MNAHSFCIDLPLDNDIIHGWWLSSRMLEGGSPVLGANGPHAVYSVSRFGLVVSRASKISMLPIKIKPLKRKESWVSHCLGGGWSITLISGALFEFKTNGNQPFLLGTWTLRKPCSCVSCVSWSFNSSYLPQRGNGKFHSSENVSVVPSLCEWMDDQVLHVIVCQLLDAHKVPVGMFAQDIPWSTLPETNSEETQPENQLCWKIIHSFWGKMCENFQGKIELVVSRAM